MDLRDFLAVLRKYYVSIVAVTLAGLIAAGLVSLFAQPTYASNTSIFFTVQGGSSPSDLLQGSTYAENQVASYAQIVTTAAVLQPVIDTLGLDLSPAELASSVTVNSPSSTAIIQISVVTDNPELSAQLAQEISVQLVRTVDTLSPTDASGSRAVAATIVTPATVPTSPISPRVPLNLAVGGLVGLALGVSQAALRSVLDLRVRTAQDVARATEHPVIAQIPFDDSATKGGLATAGGQLAMPDSHSPLAEAYRRLRTNLQFFDLDRGANAIVVTSSVAGEGKSTTAICLARTLADSGRTVLLIDADLRRPRLAPYLNLEGAAGLTTILIGRATLDEMVQPLDEEGRLQLLASGEVPPNPAELLGSEAMHRLLQEAVGRYDTVVVDAPPLLPVTDAAPLTALTRGALVVAGSGTVTIPQLRDAVTALDRVNGAVLGIVLNKVRARPGSADAAYYRDYRPETTPSAGEAGHPAQGVVPARPELPSRAILPRDVLADR